MAGQRKKRGAKGSRSGSKAKSSGGKRKRARPGKRVSGSGSEWSRRARRWLLIGAVVAIVLVVVFDVIAVNGPAMGPELADGDLVVVDRLGSELFTPDIGDVVMIRSPDDREAELMVRVTAMEEDVVTIPADGGSVYINGTPVGPRSNVRAWSQDARLLASAEAVPSGLAGSRRFTRASEAGQYTVPKGHAFVLGDNPDGSLDSRTFGPVPLADVVGRVRLVLRTSGPSGGLVGPYIALP